MQYSERGKSTINVARMALPPMAMRRFAKQTAGLILHLVPITRITDSFYGA
jgi:hypothetical protein